LQKLSDFINSALFDPASGYYRKKNPIGKNADFITAPEISQVFGELTAAYLLQIFSTKKSPIALVEMGAGKGTLFKDILTSIRKLADKKIPQAVDFFDRATFHIIEINEVLVKIQRENLRPCLKTTQGEELLPAPLSGSFAHLQDENFCERVAPYDKNSSSEYVQNISEIKAGSFKTGSSEFSVNWHETFADFLNHHNCEEIFFISNELFDCFAIDQFVKTESGWREKMVEKIAGKNQFILQKFDQKTNYFVENLLGEEISQAAPINAVFEYSESSRNFMTELCEALKKQGGMALIIDYGYAETEFANTLQAIKNHQKTFILENVGESDITALVDFSALKKIANNFDLNSSLISQREFLLALGIEERRKILLEKRSSDEQKKINSAIDRLIDSTQMGELFKCLILWK
jgi:NADH dehydrogenase [ubiquinone] 1 alpha subcomplex assembly factor 7